MIEALVLLDQEIAAHEHVLEGLRKARAIMAGAAKPEVQRSKPTQLLLPGPSAKKKRGRRKQGETQVYDINDVEVEVSQAEFDLLTTLFASDPDWVPVPSLIKVAGSHYKVKKLVESLVPLLKPAKAKIEFERGSGYRIVTDE